MQGQLFYDANTVSAAFMESLKQGEACDCPTCGRHAQIYRRKFHASIARQLIRLYWLGGTAHYIHASKLILPEVSGAGDFSKAKYWGLIYQQINTDPDTKCNGMWMLSAEGVAFVRGQHRIAREVFVFDDEVQGMSAETITIAEALGDRFNYHELMEARA
jgi:hypothetical protein